MKYSIILPYYDPEYKKTHLVTECIQSIVENSKGKDYELIIVKDGPSYVQSHNIGLSNAHGDYLVIVNDDIVILDPEWLDKLTIDNGIASWQVGMGHDILEELPNAACWLMSRPTFEKLGLMDERYKDGHNYEDTDYFLKAYKLEIPFYDAKVTLRHYGNQTFSKYIPQEVNQASHDRNREIFRTKWLNP